MVKKISVGQATVVYHHGLQHAPITTNRGGERVVFSMGFKWG